MSYKVPPDVAKAIKECVFREADDFKYLSRSKTENGRFIAALVSKDEIGKKLLGYMGKDEVRTYIKDAILNRYSKDKIKEEQPSDYRSLVSDLVGTEVALIESHDDLYLYVALDSKHYITVVTGTILKWETALRKALLFSAAKPFSKMDDVTSEIILVLFARYQKIAPSTLELLERALLKCNARPYIFGER